MGQTARHWQFIQKSVFFVFLILLLASCQGKGFIQVAEFSSQAATLDTRTTIVSWNVQKGKNENVARDLKTILEKEAPDIVFLQEARPDLFEVQAMGGYFAEAWHYPWPFREATGVLTLSRIPPVRVHPMPTKLREFGVTAPKVSLVTAYPLSNGDTLLTVNVHLLNFERWSMKNISRQLQEIRSILVTHPGPVIMAGDFNTWNQKRLELVKKMTRDMQLTEVANFPKGRSAGGTKSTFWNNILGVENDLPLDRIFLSGFTPIDTRVLSYDSSDHAPILVTLKLTP